MRIWVYGDSPEWIRDIIKENIGSDDTVTGTSISADGGRNWFRISSKRFNTSYICCYSKRYRSVARLHV